MRDLHRYGRIGHHTAYGDWLSAMADPANRSDFSGAQRFECWLMWPGRLWSDYRDFPHGSL